MRATLLKAISVLVGQSQLGERRSRLSRNLFRLRIAAVPVLLTVIVVPNVTKAQSSGLTEYQVKAAFLYNFAKFVEWPPDAFPNNTTPFTICVLGDNPFGSSLNEIVQGQTINARGFVIRTNIQKQDVKACHILFISDSEKKQLLEDLKSLRGTSVLTVGETPDFAEQGGQIQFFWVNGKIRFAVNTDAAERAHLKMSSKLLALAKIVHDEKQ